MIVGLCHICGKPATEICMICGRPTCKDHIKNRICDSCRAGNL